MNYNSNKVYPGGQNPGNHWNHNNPLQTNHQLKVSCGVSCSSVLMMQYILSSLDPFGTESDSRFERALISLMSSWMVARVDILCMENQARAEVKSSIGPEINIEGPTVDT